MKLRQGAFVIGVSLFLFFHGPACAVKVASKTQLRLPVPDPVGSLRIDLERIFSDPNFDSAFWGVEVVSLDRAQLLYERNAARLFMPASNNKILTASAALVRLGPDYRFVTKVFTDGQVIGGSLKGNLIVVGAGDPSVAPRFLSGDVFAVFKSWATQLKDRGIRAIEGELIGDARAFGEKQIGYGWEWDDLAFGYAAPVSALQFNENLVTLEITPGSQPGSPVLVKASPMPDYVAVDSKLTTAAAGSEPEIEYERIGEGESLRLRGIVPAGGKPLRQTAAVRNPTVYFLSALKHALQQEGIDVATCAVRAVAETSPPQVPLTLLWSHPSPPLSEIIKPLLKVSQNLYTETLARTLGLVVKGEGSFSRGKEVVEETLGWMAIEKGTYAYADGSGLSRHNLISADLLIRIYRYMHRHKYFDTFYAALPIAGVDGTIENRMKGTKAENNVHGKTGTIAKVRALSGYVQTADGEMLGFAMIANHFLASNKAAEYVQDSALERLANFSRK